MTKYLLVKAAAIVLATNQIAAAHGSPASHVHPHADWSLTIAILLALGAFAALFIIPAGFVAKPRSKRHDPR